jgi:FG-GAP repeat
MGDCNNNNASQLISAQTQPTLSVLTLSVGQLNPAFDSTVTVHDTMFIGNTSVTVTPTAVSGNASGAIVLPSGTTTITIVFTASNGGTNTYTMNTHRLPQRAYGKASHTGGNDVFGWRVALDGDTLAVGADSESSKGTGVYRGAEVDNSAAVYVFK